LEEGIMSDSAEFTIGTEVSACDGICGELRRVVVNPVARALTHLVVEPKHQQGTGHLVPIDLVESTGDGIRLRCTTSEFQALEDAEETQFLPGAGGGWGYGKDQILAYPYFALSGDGMGMGAMNVGPLPIVSDRVPAGEVEVRRGEHVHASDGTIGKVRGLVVEANSNHVTHVLLDEGHLWGKKTVAIPIGVVKSVDHGVQLSLSKGEVRDLPSVNIDESTLA
jgi:hypothetical protein